MVLLARALLLGAFVQLATAIRTPGAGNLKTRASDDKLADDIIINAYTVELSEGASVDDLSGQLESLGISIEPRRILNSKLFNGVSFDFLESSAAGGDWTQSKPLEEAIIGASAAKHIWPVRSVLVPPENRQTQRSILKRNFANHLSNINSRQESDDEPYVTHAMTQVDRAHEAGFTGEGVRIAILDSGIDETHPLLGGCIGPDCIIESRWDAFGVDVTDPDQFEAEFGAFDCRQHGTHVAGVIGALPNDMGFRGVAPGARLSDYRVLSCATVGTDEHIAAGMLRAFADGVDMLSMSIGFPTGAGESILAVTAQRIVEAGVPVFASVGNEGRWDPMFMPNLPASGEGVSSVSSYDPILEPVITLAGSYMSDGDTLSVGFRIQPVGAAFDFEDTEELALPLLDLDQLVGNQGNASNGNTACSPLPESIPDLSDFLILVQYTTDPESECYWNSLQQQNIFDRNGTNILFWERSVDVLGGNTELFEINERMNLGWVTSTTAKLLSESLAAGEEAANVTVTINQNRSVLWIENKVTGGQVSAFSSWGPNWDMRPAPSFGAPGHKTISTIPGGGVEILSGTSFSCPFVAGATALLIEATGSRDPETLHNRLASTSRQPPLAPATYGDFEGLHPPTQAGAGIIQIMDAIQAKGVLSTTSISFNDSGHHIDEVTVTLKNSDTEDAVYSLNQVAARTVYALSTDGYLDYGSWDSSDSAASISFYPETGRISAPAGQTVEITIRCCAPESVDQTRWPVYSGYITLNGTNGDNLVIPYVGNAGSMRDADIIFPETTNTNWVADEVKTIPRPSGAPEEGGNGDWESEELYFSVSTVTRLRTRELRVYLLPAVAGPGDSNGTPHSDGRSSCRLPTHEWLGEKTFGQVLGSPHINIWAGALTTVDFAGMLASEKIVPEGQYRLMLSALRVFREASSNKTENWQVVTTEPFFLKYEGFE